MPPENNVPLPKEPKKKIIGSNKPWPPVGKSRKIFALLAGIDDYPGPAALNGCIKDLEAVENYLRTQVHQQLQLAPGISVEANDELYLCSLKNEQATYENIITGFRKFLCFADGDDIVWFHFSGHGAQQRTAQEFMDAEANDKDQAIVCFYESKDQDKQFLLADKELGKLIEEVNTQNASGEIVDKGTPHVIITLDCCHSGTGTRSGDEVASARALTFELAPRQMESYLNIGEGSTFGRPSIRHSKHIAISACQSTEKAIDTEGGGLFTTAILRALEESGGEICYADLTGQVDLLMKQHKAEFLVNLLDTVQTPQYDSIANFNVFAKFLHPKSIIGKKDLYDVYFDGSDWMIKCGTVHGLPESSEESIGVSVLLDGKTVANTTITKVSAFDSRLENFEQEEEDNQNQSKETRYKARLINFPVAELPVFLEGEEAEINPLLESWDDTKNIVPLTEKSDDTKLQISVDNGHYEIRSLVKATQDSFSTQVLGEEVEDSEKVSATLSVLERMAHWERFHDLNRENSIIPDIVQPVLRVHLKGNDNPLTFTDSAVELVVSTEQFEEAERNNVKWHILKFDCDININTALSKEEGMDLHFYFLHLGSNYSISNWAYKIDQSEENRESKEVLDMLAGDGIKPWWGMPINKTEDHWRFKLLVTTQAITIKAMEQKGLTGTKSEGFGGPVGSSDDWFAFHFDVHLKHQEGPG